MSNSTTPQAWSSTKCSNSTTRQPLSRPTTPLRASSRSSFRDSSKKLSTSNDPNSSLPIEVLEPGFEELADSMADLEANFMHLQIMHESLARFSENFASFLYGLNMNAFCVDFPEAPIPDSFRRAREQEDQFRRSTNSEREMDGETTFLTTDTSFVDNPHPPASSKTSKFSTPVPASRIGGRGGMAPPAGRGGAARGGLRGTRGSGLARAAKPRTAK